MTSAYPPPFQRPAPEPQTPRRPLFGKVFAWAAIAFGAIFLIGAIATLEFGAVLVGALMVGAGVAYLRLSPARGRKAWAIPAIAILPALFVMGSPTTAEPETPTAVAPVAAVPALPTVTTTTATSSTTTPAPTTTTTVAPTTEPVAAVVEVPTTSEYVPLPDPVYTPEPVYTAPAPLVAVPPVVSYANCDAVRAAGAAPIYAGEPGYSVKLDRDKDGIGCDT